MQKNAFLWWLILNPVFVPKICVSANLQFSHSTMSKRLQVTNTLRNIVGA